MLSCHGTTAPSSGAGSLQLTLECPACFVPVTKRHTGTRRAYGTRQEVSTGAGSEPAATDRSSCGEREDDSPGVQGSGDRGADVLPLRKEYGGDIANDAEITKAEPKLCLCSREALFADREGHSAASSSCSPSMRICSSSRSSASMAAVTSCWTWAAASSSSGESWTLR
jgi:hypothetical protein